MNPILYSHGEKSFRTNGIGRIHPTRCIVIEERNGIYELEMDVPITDKYYSEISEGRIIYSIHDDTKTFQPFDIYKRSAPINGIVTFYAHHVSYRLGNTLLEPFSSNSIAQVFATFGYHSITDNEFSFWTDKNSTGNFSVDVPISIKEILGGVEGSILDVFGGGEYEWDGFTVKLYQDRGYDNGVQIRYGKNLVNVTHEIDTSSTFNAVAPYWKSNEEGGKIVTLPEHYIISANAFGNVIQTEQWQGIISEDGEPVLAEHATIQAVPLDLSGEFDEAPTVEQLRNKATSYLNTTSMTVPAENIEVDFVHLWQTEEYKDIANLQRVRLCDKVSVFYPALGLTAIKQQVIRTEYNVLAERYDRMELGQARTQFSEVLRGEIERSITNKLPSKNFLRDALEHATELIKGGLGGYVVINTDADGHPNEILIMDKDNIAEAVNVIRMNKNGIAFSNSGYNPDYFITAWTIDGGFNADFINAGSITAELIRGGILTDLEGKNYWNLTTGEISISLDPGEVGAVTTADLARVENNARTFANQAKLDAIAELEEELDNYTTAEQVTGMIQANNEGLVTRFSRTYVEKSDAAAYFVNWYYNSASPTQLFGGEWTTTPPEWSEAMYIWERVQTVYADGSDEYSEPVCTAGKTGQKGDKGDTGAQGIQGIQGVQGERGEQGIQGERGAQGERGEQGIQGEKGEQGAKGDKGDKGDQGENALTGYVFPDSSTAVSKDTSPTVNMTAIVTDYTDEDLDPNGTVYSYLWYLKPDALSEKVFNIGKSKSVVIDANLCTDRAIIWFEWGDEDLLNLFTESGSNIISEDGLYVRAG